LNGIGFNRKPLASAGSALARGSRLNPILSKARS
jgi:hypothetical protein